MTDELGQAGHPIPAPPKRVLAIDGGGIRGVLPAAFLATIEETLDAKVADHFDLVVGTSTGGIIALGLGLGMSAAEILGFYREQGPSIFRNDLRIRLARHLIRSKYDNRPLRAALEVVFGQRQLGDSTVRLVIPSLNLDSGEVHIFKTAHHERLKMDYKETAVDVALATAAAPTYFPTARMPSDVRLLDGGLFANNPVGLASVEALGMLEWKKGSVDILSLGCGNEPLTTRASRLRVAGVSGWLPHLMTVTFKAQSSYSIGTAQLLLGHEHLIRIDPSVAPGRFKLDKLKHIDNLVGMGAAAARKALPDVQQRFFQTPVEPFVPLRQLDQQ